MSVAEPLSDFAELMRARRSWFNHYYRRHGRGLPAGAMMQYLRRTAQPLVMAMDGSVRAEVNEALFVLGVAGLRRGLVSRTSKPAPFELAIMEALPKLAEQVQQQPRRLIAALGNCYDKLARQLSPRRALSWLQQLAELGAHCDSEQLLIAGLVLAWQHGLAEAREASLEHGQNMTEALRKRLFGSACLDDRSERRFADPGATTQLAPLRIWSRVGGFRGVGGPFFTPPEVYRLGQRLYATDGEHVRQLFADVYGARLVAAGVAAAEVVERGEQDGARISDAGALDWQQQHQTFGELRGASSCVASLAIVAVTLRASHYVFVLGRPAEAT